MELWFSVATILIGDAELNCGVTVVINMSFYKLPIERNLL